MKQQVTNSNMLLATHESDLTKFFLIFPVFTHLNWAYNYIFLVCLFPISSNNDSNPLQRIQ